MATTVVGADRQANIAFQKYPDAVFVRDDKKLFFGDDGDASISWDSSNSKLVVEAGKLNVTGGDILLSDTAKLNIGDGADASLYFDGVNLRLTTVSDLILHTAVTLGIAGRPTTSDALYFKSDTAGGGFFVMVSSG